MSCLLRLRDKSNLTNRDAIRYIEFAYKAFGYSHIDKLVASDLKINPKEIAKKLGCNVHEGVMGWYFTGTAPTLEFGQRPEKKFMRKLINESKKQNERQIKSTK